MTRSSSLSRRLRGCRRHRSDRRCVYGQHTVGEHGPVERSVGQRAPAASASGGAFTGISYPASGDAPCGVAPYTGTIKKITATDRLTVEFQLCASDVAFLPKVAFATFGIQDSDYLAAHAKDKSYLTQPNGTGPYKLTRGIQGNRIVFEANPNYWGDAAKAPKAELRWSDTLPSASSSSSRARPSTAWITRVATRSPRSRPNRTSTFMPRPAMNTMYIGMNRAVKPGTTRTSGRPSRWASTASASSTTSIRKGQK